MLMVTRLDRLALIVLRGLAGFERLP